MLIMIARCTSTWRWSSSLRATPRLAASSSLVGGRPRVIVSASAAASVRRAAARTERLAQSPERSSSSTAPCSRASAYVAKEAPALGSNLRATSTSATCAQDSRSSRLTCPKGDPGGHRVDRERGQRQVLGHQRVHLGLRPCGRGGRRLPPGGGVPEALFLGGPLPQRAVGHRCAGWSHALLLGCSRPPRHRPRHFSCPT